MKIHLHDEVLLIEKFPMVVVCDNCGSTFFKGLVHVKQSGKKANHSVLCNDCGMLLVRRYLDADFKYDVRTIH